MEPCDLFEAGPNSSGYDMAPSGLRFFDYGDLFSEALLGPAPLRAKFRCTYSAAFAELKSSGGFLLKFSMAFFTLKRIVSIMRY